jgi:hypothetical protein
LLFAIKSNVVQVELVHTQFKRAKERSDTPDDDLFNDLMCVYNSSSSANVDPDILRRLSEKLQLVTISDLNQESLALHEMASDGDPGAVVEKMSMLLKKIKDFVQTQDPGMGDPASTTSISPKDNSTCPVIPDDFRCPISLDLMKDPVIVATGQVVVIPCPFFSSQSTDLTFAFHLTIFCCICLCRLTSEGSLRDGWRLATIPVRRHNRSFPVNL